MRLLVTLVIDDEPIDLAVDTEDDARVRDLASVVATNSSGKVWLTGGAYGPQGALFTVFVVLGGMFALYQMTRDYAWDYTHPVILPGGYPMEARPPAAHTAMEQAVSPAPLVQILGVTSTGTLKPQATEFAPGPATSADLHQPQGAQASLRSEVADDA